MGKQLKINELKRVVNIDKFSKYANILKDTNFNDERQIDSILNELALKTPSREVLMKTKLGFILKEISNRERLSKKIRDKALNLRTKWKDFHKKLLLAPKYDVKCDKPTTENRQKARQALLKTFINTNASSNGNIFFDSNQEEHITFVNDLEFAIFNHNDNLVNNKYFNLVRKCIRVINEKSKIRNDFLNYDLKAEDLIKQYLVTDSPFKNFLIKQSSSSSLFSDIKPSTSSSSSSSFNDIFDFDDLIDL
ncbi:unnamed protein product [Brachionus calyciflorus]|uniref:TFIIS N-terminal domain-containing protein n=1 Tax=Brachionus calyciflorus TaxID=104777 RepID=A0A814BGT0_9BILA|nr:unnamed protein product [Brachionus calyciflorus]